MGKDVGLGILVLCCFLMDSRSCSSPTNCVVFKVLRHNGHADIVCVLRHELHTMCPHLDRRTGSLRWE